MIPNSPSSNSSAFHQVLCSRRTVHEYTSEPVREDVLRRALEAACAAPNHRMTEPWRFVLVGPQSREQLLTLSLELKSRDAPVSEATAEKARRKMLAPSHLLAVARRRHDKPDVEREDYAAVACAIQNLMLSLWSEGVGTKWSTGAVTRHERTYALLGVDPVEQELVGFVWVGIPAAVTRKPPRRLELDALLTRVP